MGQAYKSTNLFNHEPKWVIIRFIFLHPEWQTWLTRLYRNANEMG